MFEFENALSGICHAEKLIIQLNYVRPALFSYSVFYLWITGGWLTYQWFVSKRHICKTMFTFVALPFIVIL